MCTEHSVVIAFKEAVSDLLLVCKLYIASLVCSMSCAGYVLKDFLGKVRILSLQLMGSDNNSCSRQLQPSTTRNEQN